VYAGHLLGLSVWPFFRLIERNDLATMAIARVIIGLAKEGERDPRRLCALALKRISK
jgi:hypothetical protein